MKALLNIAALLSCLLPSTSSGKSQEGLAEALARLRGEVETLSNRIETRRADQQARIRSLATQQAELEIQIKREQLRLKQLARLKAQRRSRVERLNQRQHQLAPLVAEISSMLQGTLARTLPFQRRERVTVPDELRVRFERKMVDVDGAIAQLWALVEDELRLGRESGIYNQTLKIDGVEQLVEVARLGMAMLFFRTSDGRYGVVRSEGERWRAVVMDDKEARSRIALLFDALKKQIRTGFFTLPDPGISAGGR